MKNFLLSLFCLFASISTAQIYIPFDTSDYNQKITFIQKYNESNKLFINQVKENYKRKISNRIEAYLKYYSENLIAEIKESHFVFDERFTSKVNEILNEFKKHNSQIPHNTHIVVSKNPALNAFCLPDGTFIINMGLFYYLKNEDQIASVIAHEISHKILEHYIKIQIQSIENELLDESKIKIKEIEHVKYKKSEKAFELYKSMLYAKGDIQKNQEYQADSLGYILLKNTKYNRLNYIEMLKLIEEHQKLKPKGLKKEIYRKMFDLPNQKFKEDWLRIEDFSSYEYSYKEKFNEDSLSTHPETKNRIKRLETLFPELKNPILNVEDENFKILKIISEYEQVISLQSFEEYGLSTYICLYRLQENKNQEFYKSILGKNFIKIYESKKQYKLNRYIDRIDPRNHSESYIQFLSFIWNLKLDEIKLIMEYYNL